MSSVTHLVLESPKDVPVAPDPNRLPIWLDWVQTTRVTGTPPNEKVFIDDSQWPNPNPPPAETRKLISYTELMDLMGEDGYAVMKKESTIHGNSSRHDVVAVSFMDAAKLGITDVEDSTVLRQLNHFESQGFLSTQIIDSIKAGV